MLSCAGSQLEKVTLLADRGFGDQKLFGFLRHTLGFEFIIRIRGNIIVTSAQGESRPAAEFLAYGFARAYCEECGHDFLIAFSCEHLQDLGFMPHPSR
jgi:hypothetical protein